MALVYYDRVKETSTTTGTGTYALLGAATGFQAFSVVGNGNTCYYTATDGTSWEVGLGTWATGGTLARTSVLASSNGGAAVSWAAGSKDVFLTAPATVFASLYSDPLTTRGDILTRGAAVTQRVALGADGTIVSSDGTDTIFRTLSALLDVGIGSTRGMLASRGASGWGSLAVGASGYVLRSDGTDPGWGAPAYPAKYMDGLRPRYSSSSAIVVEAGACRDKDDAYNLALAADATVQMNVVGVAGIDEATLSTTATTHGTATFEPAASIYSETAMAAVVRSLSGTITSSATTVTGSATKFLSELAIGDVIRTASNGAARVTAIASNTSLTIAAAFPGGDVGVGQACTVYENLHIRVAAEQPRRVNTITHAGTSVVASSAWTSNTTGVTLKIGGRAPSVLMYPHVIYGGSGTSACASTQRTKPYPISGYSTASRMVGCFPLNSSLNVPQYLSAVSGQTFWWDIVAPGSNFRVVSGGTATSATRVDLSSAVPSLARRVRLFLQSEYSSSGTNDDKNTLFIFDSSAGTDDLVVVLSGRADNAEHGASNSTVLETSREGKQEVYYKNNQAAGSAYIDIVGFTMER